MFKLFYKHDSISVDPFTRQVSAAHRLLMMHRGNIKLADD